MRGDPDSMGGAHYSIAENGTLIYLPGPATPGWDIAVADGKGRVEPLHLPPLSFEAPRVSPDGARIAMHSTEGNQSNIYVYDLSGRSALRRLTFEGNNRLPVWTSDGNRIAFQSDREKDRAIFWQRADGTGSAERLTRPEQDEIHEPEAWSRKGDTLLFTVTKEKDVSLWMFSLRTRRIAPVGNVKSSTPTGAVFSPDDKWVAYAATEGSKTTIYVQPFPPTGFSYELLGEGAEKPNHPLWSPDGKVLYFNPGPGQFSSVSVTTNPNFAFGNVVSLPRPFRHAHLLKPRPYDVLPDGKLIAAIASGQSGAGRPTTPQIHVVLNWFADLRARGGR